METATHDHHNPFEVLELPATASGREVTRQKDKLLGMLELGLDRAKRYAASTGEKERTAELVRTAAQELERPRSRLGWELWVPPSDAEVEADPEAAAMRRALALHRQLSRDEAFGVEELDELGLAWDVVFASDILHDRIAARAEELELELDEGEVYDEFRDEVRGQVRTLFDRGPVFDLDKLESELATEVAHELADHKVEVLELACSRISKHKLQQKQRREQWNGLVREYASVVNGRGDYLRRAAFDAVSSQIGDLAAELFNDNIDHSTAHSMFQWLRDEAKNLDDEELHKLYAGNASTVGSRIQRDNAALYETPYQAPSSSDSGSGARAILTVIAGIIFAAIRFGNGCNSSTSYQPSPSYSVPRSYHFDSARTRELLRDLENTRPYRGLEEPYQTPGLDHEPTH